MIKIVMKDLGDNFHFSSQPQIHLSNLRQVFFPSSSGTSDLRPKFHNQKKLAPSSWWRWLHEIWGSTVRPRLLEEKSTPPSKIFEKDWKFLLPYQSVSPITSSTPHFPHNALHTHHSAHLISIYMISFINHHLASTQRLVGSWCYLHTHRPAFASLHSSGHLRESW